MSQDILIPPAEEDIVYPDSDGKRMADNTLQFRWIVTIEGGVDALFAPDPDVFVAGDLLWYPVKGRRDICQAPDILVAFGRPKGYRGSYKQWLEGDIAPKVVFEILSPSNTPKEMELKFVFYETYAVEEYYVYDPDRIKLSGWIRKGDRLKKIAKMNGWKSPLLGIRFVIGEELEVFGPDGKQFLSYTELVVDRNRATDERDGLAAKRDELATERDDLAAERDTERQRREAAEQQAARLREKLKALGLDPDA